MDTSRTVVNVEQARGWDGPEGDSWTENEEWYNAAVRYLTPHLFDGARVAEADRVLDVGCGCGETTRDAARAAPRGAALGVDLSTRMIERARERAAAEGLHNVRFERGDAQVYPFEAGAFDVAISRFGSMFFEDPVAAFANIGAALTPGGRIALLCWREIGRNEWLTEMRAALAAGRDLPEPPAHAPSAVAFADAERVRAILTSAGFDDVALDPVDEPLYFGADTAHAFGDVTKQGIVKGLLADLDDAARAEALDRLRDSLAKHETPDGILLRASAWLVRAAKAR